jgi:cullin 3
VLKALDMEDKELRRTLQSLACAKHKLLIKTPKGRDVEPDDTFAYNPKFDCKQLRIKVRAAASHFARAASHFARPFCKSINALCNSI